MEKIRVAIVDDQKLFRQSLALMVGSVNEFELVAEADNGQQFLDEQAVKGTAIDVAIIDMDMPGINGIELNDVLQHNYPSIKVIILSVHIHARLITQMIDAGAAAYLAKNCDKDELIMAVKTVHSAGFYFNNDVMKALQNGTNHKFTPQRKLENASVKLTDREMQLLLLICKEHSNAEIAEKLFLSVRTIEGHRNNLIAKIGCRNTAGVVLFAIKHNLFKIIF